MDQDFQTSFIPKKPMLEKRATASQPVGILIIVSLFILFTAIVASGGLYFYKNIKLKDLDKMKKDLELSKGRFEQSKIQQLQVLDKRLQASDQVLAKHITVSPIFKTLQAVTMKTVRFTTFNYTIEDNSNKIRITMKGQASNYRSIALQADLFSTNVKQFIDPIFSDLSLDDKGNVVFDLEFFVEPSFVNYKQVLKVEGEAPSPIPLPVEALELDEQL